MNKLNWALRHRLSLADKAVLVALVALTKSDGTGEVNQDELAQRAGVGERQLHGALHSLLDRGLVNGLRWSKKSGWTGEVRLALEIEPGRHLRAVA